MKSRFLLFIGCAFGAWIAVALPGCTPPGPGPGPGPITPPPDAADSAPPAPMPEAGPGPVPVPEDCSSCSSSNGCACCILRHYRCPEGGYTPRGESCELIYADRATFPGLEAVTSKEMACVGKATSQAQIRKCGVHCE